MATRDVFSDDELAQLRGFPEPARAELIRYFTLGSADEAFVRKFRGQDNVMGVAAQLGTLPWLGFVPDDVAAAPAAVVARLSEKLGIPVGALCGYGAREQTRTGHLREVAAYLGWRTVDGPRWKDLEEFLFARAMEHDSPKLLFRQACEYLSSSMLVRPGIVKILERVAAARERAREETWARVAPLLTLQRQAELGELLAVDPVLGRTRLSWLGTGPVAATPTAVKGELEKLAYLRGLGAGGDRRADRVHRSPGARGRQGDPPAGPEAEPAVRDHRRGHQHGPGRDGRAHPGRVLRHSSSATGSGVRLHTVTTRQSRDSDIRSVRTSARCRSRYGVRRYG